jgi:hypothetical protein
MHPFRNLILVALGRESSLQKIPNRDEWDRMFRMAHMQALVGITYEGLRRLPPEQLPPLDILDRWDRMAGKVASIYQLHEKRVAELEGRLDRLGLHACILKGTSLSHLYPFPEARMCGDIDIWAEGTHASILEALRPACPVREILYQECKADFFDDVTVEVHFHASKMYNPVLNARLQRCLSAHSPIRPDRSLTLPDLRFHAIQCMAHMFHHYLEGGLGLRQMMDYYFVLLHMAPADRAPVLTELRRLGMGRFTAAMMESLRFNFGLEREYLLCDPDPVLGRKLMMDAFRYGNFGVLDARNRHKADETRRARFLRKNARVWSHLRYYPREVVWAPYARVHHFLWRRLHGFL